MSGLTKRVRGANAPVPTSSTGVLGGGHGTGTDPGAPPSADLVERLLTAFTDDAGPTFGHVDSGEGNR